MLKVLNMDEYLGLFKSPWSAPAEGPQEKMVKVLKVIM